MKGVPHAARKRTGDAQWKPGRVPCFDDLMVLVLGVEWRTFRDSCAKTQWKTNSAELVDLICDSWGLPSDPSRTVLASHAARKAKPASDASGALDGSSPVQNIVQGSLDTVTHHALESGFSTGASQDGAGAFEKAHPGDRNWTHDRQRLLCVVDNQVVAETVSGRVALADLEVRPIFDKIGASLLKLLDTGLRPPKDCMSPVEWRPRGYNKRPDAICNALLDGASSFKHLGDNADVVIHSLRPHFLLHSDGGCRNTGRSAIGYVIYAIIYGYGEGVEYYTLEMGGEHCDKDLPSFELEARALSLALARLVALLAPCTVV